MKDKELLLDYKDIPENFEDHLKVGMKRKGIETRIRQELYQLLQRPSTAFPPQLPAVYLKEPIDYFRKAQASWERRISKPLNNVCVELNYPLTRKRNFSEQKDMEDRWSELGAEDIDTSQFRPVYAPKDFLETLSSLRCPNATTTDTTYATSSNHRSQRPWNLITIPLRSKSFEELQKQFRVFNVHDHESGAVVAEHGTNMTQEEQRIEIGNKVLSMHYAPLAREYAKRGCPQSVRGDIWCVILGVRVTDNDRLYYDHLKSLVITKDLMIDKLIVKDVKLTSSNDDQYFVFEDFLHQVMLLFSRDKHVLNHFAYSSATPLKTVIKDNAEREVAEEVYPPNGIIPYHGFSTLTSPLCYLYDNPVQLYFMFREWYVRFFFRLHTVNSHPQGILRLALLFEQLVATEERDLCSYFNRRGIQPLKIVFKWLMRAFSGYLPTEQVLQLWDTVLAYDTVEILSVLAAAIVSFRSPALAQIHSQEDAEVVLSDLSSIQKMRPPRRNLLVLLALLSATVSLLLLVQWRRLSLSVGRRHYDRDGRDGLLVNSATCRIPDIDPFDTSIAALFQPVAQPLRCELYAGPSLVGVSYDNRSLWLDVEAVAGYGETSDSMSCRLAAIRRKGDGRTDDKYRIVPLGRILTGNALVMNEEFVQVMCRNRAGKLLYSDYFAFVLNKGLPGARKLVVDRNRKRRLGAVLLIVDSVSRLNFMRHFPRTLDVLTSGSLASRTVQLTGYTKVGDNTLPNLVALLTGLSLPEALQNRTRDGRRTFDGLPLIWKEFSARGMRTLYAEDNPEMATFNYLRGGFLRQPTDYYFRPLTLATQNSEMRRSSRHPHCFNARMEMDSVLQWLNDFLHRFGVTDPVFALTLLSRLTHDDLNLAGLADRPLADFLQAASGLLDHCVLFVLSDHGIRFGPILSKQVGKMEERLPFHFVVVPPWFATEHPDRWRSLRENAHRLSSPFDLHATLLDILTSWNNNYKVAAATSSGGRGRSLLRALPENRSCDEAGIAPHWCVCQTRRPIDVDDARVQIAALHVIEKIGAILNDFRNVCAPLTLIGVMDAQVSELPEKVVRHRRRSYQASPGGRIRDYLLTLKVKPSGAIFEASVRHWRDSSYYEVMGQIGRLDRYGEQSWCVDTALLRLYCFCTNRTISALL